MCTKMFKSFKYIKIGSNLLFKRSLQYKHPELNLEYICNPKNLDVISENVSRRKGVGNIGIVQELYHKLKDKQNDSDIQEQFYSEAKKIPNDTHPEVINYGNDPKVIKYVGNKPEFVFKPYEFHEITKKLNLMRTEQLGNVSGNRSYYFLGILAELEQALIKYTIQKLVRLGFQVISVPDIIPASVIENCGMTIKGERTQIYALDPELHGKDLCLSGTSEMAIAEFLQDKVIPIEKLPMKIAAVSRCYRAETSSIAEEKGIYRVHQFTKVEMFSVTTPSESNATLESFREIQENHFSSLGLHLQILDMPPHELGAPAYRKYDLEAWLPGRNIYGEVSSCSNCTDYQSRRLNIKYEDENGALVHTHTVNGTACAVPRMLIALIETYQNDKGFVSIPEVLRPFMRDQSRIVKQKNVPELKLKKIKRCFVFSLLLFTSQKISYTASEETMSLGWCGQALFEFLSTVKPRYNGPLFNGLITDGYNEQKIKTKNTHFRNFRELIIKKPANFSKTVKHQVQTKLYSFFKAGFGAPTCPKFLKNPKFANKS